LLWLVLAVRTVIAVAAASSTSGIATAIAAIDTTMFAVDIVTR
jgi:hypothetical protein